MEIKCKVAFRFGQRKYITKQLRYATRDYTMLPGYDGASAHAGTLRDSGFVAERLMGSRDLMELKIKGQI